ncbi:hypothetical protein [Ruegeria halocynthiae]|uniref:hypothetical protein n=1 Tax=Ruegeria halocynthiae TaxID=985054 RepID=UPI00094500E1
MGFSDDVHDIQPDIPAQHLVHGLSGKECQGRFNFLQTFNLALPPVFGLIAVSRSFLEPFAQHFSKIVGTGIL